MDSLTLKVEATRSLSIYRREIPEDVNLHKQGLGISNIVKLIIFGVWLLRQQNYITGFCRNVQIYWMPLFS